MLNLNLEPLIHQIKEFNANQILTNQLLTQILAELQSNPLAFNKDNANEKSKK